MGAFILYNTVLNIVEWLTLTLQTFVAVSRLYSCAWHTVDTSICD